MKYGAQKKQSLLGFTLVELIVVITILVILGTIAFLSFGDYVGQSRDSQRVSNLSTISKGLEIFTASNTLYPIPDNSIQINNSGAILLYQGVIGTQVSSLIKIAGNTLFDPLDKSLFTYSISADRKKYELLGFLEKPITLGSSIHIPLYSTAYAATGTIYPITKGNEIGIFLNTTSLVPADRDGVNIDISTTTGSYRAVLNNTDSIEGSGTRLIGLTYLQKIRKYDSSLVGYWDMETTLSGGLADLSGYGNTGTPTGSITIGGVPGKFGAATYSASSTSGSQYIRVLQSTGSNLLIPDTLTVTFWLKYSAGDCNFCTLLNRMGTTGYMFQRYATGSQIYQRIDTASGINQTTTAATVLDGTWHYLTYTMDRGARKTYIDGNLFATNNYLYGNGFTNINDVIFFVNSPLNFQISMDEIRIYKRALSSSEIKNLVDKNQTDL